MTQPPLPAVRTILPTPRSVHFSTHSQSTPLAWFNSVYKEFLTGVYSSYETRINGAGRASWRILFQDIPAHAEKFSYNKVVMSPCVFRDLEPVHLVLGAEMMEAAARSHMSLSGEPMSPAVERAITLQIRRALQEITATSHEDVICDPVRVVDLDCPEGSPPATVEQVRILAARLPGVALILSNGIQVFMRSAKRHLVPWEPIDQWETEARMLSAIGKKLETFVAPLFYDRSCHLNKDATVGNHRNHMFRAPWGACADGSKVRSWLPKTKELASVREIFELLGCEMPPLVSRDMEQERSGHIKADVDTHENARAGVKNELRTRNTGSLAESQDEYQEIRQYLTDLVNAGLSRKDAENEVLLRPWKHYTAPQLKKRFPKMRLIGSGDERRLSDAEWKGIQADLKELTYPLGKVSEKRRWYQKTWTLGANRAWSFEFLYTYGFTMAESIECFMTWGDFAKIRQLSIEAIGETKVREDLARCWEKFWIENYGENPYANLAPVSKATLARVLLKAKMLGKFTLSEIRKHLTLSATQTRDALGILCSQGKLIALKKNKGRFYLLPALFALSELESAVDISGSNGGKIKETRSSGTSRNSAPPRRRITPKKGKVL